MDFKVLASFIVLYEVKHYSKAAILRSLSQPALSRQIQALERDLGYPLFIRGRSGVVPTNQGKDFYEKIIKDYTHLKNQYEGLKSDAKVLSGDYFIGTYTELGHSLVNPMLRTFNRDHPQLRLHLRFLQTETIFEQLKKGELDLGIFNPGDLVHQLTTYPLATETHVLVSGTAQSAKKFPNAKNDFFSYSVDDFFINRMVKELTKVIGKFKWEIIYTVNSLTAIIDSIQGTDCYAVLPTHRIKNELAEKKLFPVPGPTLKSNLYLAQMDEMRSEYRSKILRKFLADQFRMAEAQS